MYVSPGQVAKFPALMALSQVDLTGNPAVAWRWRTNASTLGKSYTMKTTSKACLASDGGGFISLGPRYKANCHSMDTYIYLQLVRMCCPVGEKTVTLVFENVNVQSVS